MVISCTAYGCTRQGGKNCNVANVAFHRFPHDAELRKKWVIATRRDKFIPSDASRICSDHFSCDDYKDYQFTQIKKYLKKGAVPSIFNFSLRPEKRLRKPRKVIIEMTSDGNVPSTQMDAFVENKPSNLKSEKLISTDEKQSGSSKDVCKWKRPNILRPRKVKKQKVSDVNQLTTSMDVCVQEEPNTLKPREAIANVISDVKQLDSSKDVCVQNEVTVQKPGKIITDITPEVKQTNTSLVCLKHKNNCFQQQNVISKITSHVNQPSTSMDVCHSTSANSVPESCLTKNILIFQTPVTNVPKNVAHICKLSGCSVTENVAESPGSIPTMPPECGVTQNISYTAKPSASVLADSSKMKNFIISEPCEPNITNFHSISESSESSATKKVRRKRKRFVGDFTALDMMNTAKSQQFYAIAKAKIKDLKEKVYKVQRQTRYLKWHNKTKPDTMKQFEENEEIYSGNEELLQDRLSGQQESELISENEVKTCCVKNCKNTLGSLFPKPSQMRNHWLKILNLSHATETSFVCFGHLETYNLINTNNETVSSSFETRGICRCCMATTNLIKKLDDLMQANVAVYDALQLTGNYFELDVDREYFICYTCYRDLRAAFELQERCQSTTLKLESMQRKQTAERVRVKPRIERIIKEPKLHNKSMKINVLSEVILSACGCFTAEIKTGLLNTKYVKTDGFIYVYGLRKGYKRNLRCLLSKCVSKAIITIDDANNYCQTITVVRGHNHPAFQRDQEDQLVFLWDLQRKLRLGSSLDVRTIYEEACLKNPEIRTRLPMPIITRELSNMKCKVINTEITSFEEFYNKIEDDDFADLHFTVSGAQFYQERFVTENNDLAVIFANKHELERLSDCTTMYVDSSFKVTSRNTFRYQLLTVLLKINETYYPTLFAIVNNCTFEIYKVILEYLRSKLAPTLKPSSIITDYELNLQYALAAVFSESVISGSVFHYAQNIYEKICALDLADELEDNDSLHMFFYMILTLPLLPLETITDNFAKLERLVKSKKCSPILQPLLAHVQEEWIERVTPELFCAYLCENRISKAVITPMAKLNELLYGLNGKLTKDGNDLVQVVRGIIDMESLTNSMSSPPVVLNVDEVVEFWRSFKNETELDVTRLFRHVMDYLQFLENQLWTWGLYKCVDGAEKALINIHDFTDVNVIENMTNNTTVLQNKVRVLVNDRTEENENSIKRFYGFCNNDL